MKKSIFALSLIPAALLPLIGGTDLHFHRRPSAGKLRVACVGDSITNGALIPGCFFHSYPAQLEQLLGEGYQVENFGLNDRTLQNSADKPYRREKEYRRSLAFNPDIVIVMLGTNDTKAKNFRSVRDFADEYIELVRSYQELPTSPTVMLCLPPWAINADNKIKGLTNDTDASVLPRINEGVALAAEELGLKIIDLYSLFENRPELLNYDGVHPNYRGARLIAERVKQSVLDAECRKSEAECSRCGAVVSVKKSI